MQKKYGEWRVLDTPLSESGFVGAAIGAAMMGLRPVVEMQFADFISCAFDQITEVAAKNHYRWGAAVPWSSGLHSAAASMAVPFTPNVPKAGSSIRRASRSLLPRHPMTPRDCLKAAIRDPNPVLYFEHKFLYRRIKGTLPAEDYIVPIGKAEVKRTGSDISIITYGAMVHLALEAAEVLTEKESNWKWWIFAR